MDDKRHFDTGAVRDNDQDKPDFLESVSWLALERFCKYMDASALRYGKGNWEKGLPPEECIKSTIRHLQKLLAEWRYGICVEHNSHASAIVFNMFCLLHEIELYKYGKGRLPISEHFKKLYPEEFENKTKTLPIPKVNTFIDGIYYWKNKKTGDTACNTLSNMGEDWEQYNPFSDSKI